MYAYDLVVIAKTEDLNECKANVENSGIRVNMNTTKVMISGDSRR